LDICINFVIFAQMAAKAVLVLVVLALVCVAIVQAKWVVDWHDEFSGSQLNRANWDIDLYPPGKRNNELQAYIAEEVYLKKGALVLRQRKQHYTSPDGWTAQYTSGEIRSTRLKSFYYGRFEARARVPKGRGFWPAIWLLPQDNSGHCWPNGGEIDIMEVLSQDTTVSHSTYHWGPDCNVDWSKGATYKSPEDLSKGFHVYAAEWAPSNIKFYVDKKLVFTLKNGDKGSGGSLQFPPKPMGWILNVAIGGDWPVPPDHSTPFPNYMLVDYVRHSHWVADKKAPAPKGPAKKKHPAKKHHKKHHKKPKH